MLYDILPPLFLLTSFGGIAIIISRVVMRVQREELSQHIKAQVHVQRTSSAEDLLRSEKGSKVSVVKNRLALVPQALKSTREHMRERAKQRREQKEEKQRLQEVAIEAQAKQAAEEEEVTNGKQIIQPQEGKMQRLRERMGGMLSRGKDKVTQMRNEQMQKLEERRQAREQARAEQEAILSQQAAHAAASVTPKSSKPTVRRVHEEPAIAQDQSSRGGMRNVLRRKIAPKVNDPLQQAAVCLRKSQFDQAEDILLPYIVQHARDVKAYMLLGRAALGRDDWDEAVEIFQQVRSIDDSIQGLYACLGIAAARAGKMTLAVESLQKARDLEPENITIREELLTIARRTDNSVLERSVTEELRELRQEKVAAEA